jgi:hypothetical protein
MAAVGAAFLLAIGRALAPIYVENDRFGRSPPVHLIDRLTGQTGEGGKASPAGSATSSRTGPIWLAEVPAPVIARRPPNGSPDRGTTFRRCSRPRSRQAARTPIAAVSRRADGGHSCRYARQRAYRPRVGQL